MFVSRYVIFFVLMSISSVYSSNFDKPNIEFNNSIPQFVYEEEFTANKEELYAPRNIKTQLNLVFRLGYMLLDMSKTNREQEISWMRDHTRQNILKNIDEEFIEFLNKSKNFFNFDLCDSNENLTFTPLEQLNDLFEKYDQSNEKITQCHNFSFSIFKNLGEAPYFYPEAYKGLLSVSDQMNVPSPKKINLIQSLMWKQDVYCGYSKENSLKFYIYENYPELLPFEEAFRIAEEKYFKSSPLSTHGLHPITLKILCSIANASEEDSRRNVKKARATARLRLFELAENFQEAFTESLDIIKRTQDWKSLIKIFENRTQRSQKKIFDKNGRIEFESLINDTYDCLKNINLPLDEKLALSALLVRQLKNHGELIEKKYFTQELDNQVVFEFFKMILAMESHKAQNFLHYVIRSFNQIILESNFSETLDMGVLLTDELLSREGSKHNQYLLSIFQTFIKKDAHLHSAEVLVKAAKSKATHLVSQMLSSLYKKEVSQLFTDLSILFIDEFKMSGNTFFEKIKEKEEYLKFLGYEKLPSFGSIKEQENFYSNLKEKISYVKFLKNRESSEISSLEEDYLNTFQKYTFSEGVENFIKNNYENIYSISFNPKDQISKKDIHPILRPLFKYLSESKHNYVQFLTSEAVSSKDTLFDFVIEQAYGKKVDVSLLNEIYLSDIYEYYYYKGENKRNRAAYKKRELATSSLSKPEFLESFIEFQKSPQQETFNLISQQLDNEGITLHIKFELWKNLMQKNIYPQNLIIGAGFVDKDDSIVRESKLSMTDFSIDIDQERHPSLALNAFKESALTDLSELLRNKIKLIQFDHVLSVFDSFSMKKELKFYNVPNIKSVFQKYFSMLQTGGKLEYFSLVDSCSDWWKTPTKLEDAIKGFQEIGFKLLQDGVTREPFYGFISSSYYIGLEK